MLDLSIIIVSFNTKNLTLSCIESIARNTKDISYEILVIENASSDGSKEALEKLKKKIPIKLIVNGKNFGFAKANNQGVAAASGRFVLFLNSDTLTSGNILGEMLAWLESQPKVGAVTCALKGADGKIQQTGGYFPSLLTVFSWMTIQDFPYVDSLIKPFHPVHARSFLAKGYEFYEKPRQLDWITGAFLLTRKEILDDIGGWDGDYFMYMEEVDLCFRVKKAGWTIWYLPKWGILHYGGASSTAEFPLLSEYSGIKRFYKKFYPAWQFPFLRFFLKLGALGRIVIFGILEGVKGAKIYAKAFKMA